MDQHNVNGTNIGENHGQVTNNYFYDTDTEWLVPYNIIMASNRKKQFLPDASEYLIESGKVCLNTFYINAVQQYLNDYNVCLIKAPEGRGKTFLSRIIAYYCHKQEREVFFVDFSQSKDKKDKEEIKINSIKKVLLSWNKDREKKHLLVLENVHAYQQLYELVEEINGWSSDTEFNDTNIWFLLNARPTDEGVDYFSDWKGIVDLKPDMPDIDEIIGIYSKEVGREPFPNAEAREEFINEKIYPKGNNSNGTNLRLLGYYVKTWQEKAKADEIYYVTNVSEEDIIERIKCFYNIDTIDEDDLIVLLYISCIFQFDTPLDTKIIDQSRLFEYDNPTIKNTKRLEKFVRNRGVLRKKQGRYSLPHSFDAYYLCKAICNYTGKDYITQTNEHVNLFINTILESKEPRKFEGDFKLLYSGLKARKEEFKNTIQYLISFDKAKEIIENLDPGFVIPFFHTSINPHALSLYEENKKWFVSSFLKLNTSELSTIVSIFKNYINYNGNIVKDIFESTDDLNGYLRNHHQIFLQKNLSIIKAIVESDSEYRMVLISYLENNINKLKSLFLTNSPVRLFFSYRTYKIDLDYNILKVLFKDPKDLENYLRINDKVFLQNRLLEAISGMGEEYKHVLIDYYKQNSDSLKSSFLEFNPIKLVFAYKAFKKHLKYNNIFKDIFKDPNDLENYLRINDKVFHDNEILEAISGISEKHKHVLIDYYKQNIDRLKPSFLELSPTRLYFIYRSFKSDLNIIKDIFKDPKDLNNTKDLEDYLTRNNITLNSTTILKAVCDLGDPHKDVLKNFYDGIRFDYFLCSTKNDYRISSGIIDALLFSNLTFDIHRIDENNFYFAGIHWMDIQRFVYIIRKNMNVNNKQHSIEVVKAIIQKVLEIKGSLSHASAHDLSHFYTNIDAVDHETYQQLIEEESVISDINGRLDAFTCTIPNLYLFGHFYSQPWCKEILEQKINNADDGQIAIIKEWHDKVLEGLQKEEKAIEKGTLLDYIHNKPFIQQQNN